MKKKLLGLLFALVLCALILPAAAFADDNYLTFTAKADNSSVTFNYDSAAKDSDQTSLVTSVDTNRDAVFYKKNNDAWQYYLKGTSITLNKNETVSFAGTNVTTNINKHFSMTGSIAASGDVGTLTDGKGGSALTLSDACYSCMFYDCGVLITAPELPAKKLSDHCYDHMFAGCYALDTAPILPAEELGEYCYYHMFDECERLVNAPASLPAKELKNHCYDGMFLNCESLETPPELPAEKLSDYCYSSMFGKCFNLSIVPVLPATELKEGCYFGMFAFCYSLTAPADLSDVTTAVGGDGNDTFGSCIGMYTYCVGLRVYNTPTDGYSKPWKATKVSKDEAPSGWADNMFAYTAYDSNYNPILGAFTGSPEAGTVYYVQGEGEPEISVVGESSHQLDTSETLTFKSTADFGFFKAVKIDGTEISAGNYEAKKGSTIVTLKADYLNTLSVGEHKIAIVSRIDDTTTWEPETTFTIAAKGSDNSNGSTAAVNNPNTGLTGNDAGLVLALLACAGAVVLMATRRIRSEK